MMMQGVAARPIGGALVAAVENGWIVSYCEKVQTPQLAVPGAAQPMRMRVLGPPDYEGGPREEREVEFDATDVGGPMAQQDRIAHVTRVFTLVQRTAMLELLERVLAAHEG